MPTDAQDLAVAPAGSDFVAAGDTAAANAKRASRAAFWHAVREEVVADWPVYYLAFAYVLTATVMSRVLGNEPKLVLFMYGAVWSMTAAGGVLAYFLCRHLVPAVREQPSAPLTALLKRSATSISPRGVAAIGLIALQALVMGAFTSVKNMLTDLTGYVWDARLADLDAWLHGGVDPWRWLVAIPANPVVLEVVEHLYLTLWMMLLVAVPAIVAMLPSLARIRLRLYLTYLLAWIFIGNLGAGVFMSAGPAFYGEITGDAARFQPLIDHLSATAASPFSAYTLQHNLWAAFEHSVVSVGSGISAFPSMHVAMATLWVLVGFKAGRGFGIAALGFLAFIMCASVALGWHYAVDGYFSIVAVVLLWKGIGWLLSRTGLAPARSPDTVAPRAAGPRFPRGLR